MSRTRYTCWTYGEFKQEGQTLRNADGSWAGHISFGQYKSVCGQWVDDADTVDWEARRRPAGVCRHVGYSTR